MKLDVSQAPTFADPQAAIAWSGGVTTTLKTDMQAKSLVGLGSGESLQLSFTGDGWVLIQPSEGRPVAVSAGWPAWCSRKPCSGKNRRP